MTDRVVGRAEAAQVLGVAADASPRQVRSAFRGRVRSLHPDAGEGSFGADMDELVRARDLLLAPRPTAEPGAAAPGRPPPTVVARPPRHEAKPFGVLWWVLVGVAAVAVAVAVVIAVVAVASGDGEGPAPASGAEPQCLVVGVDEVFESQCGAPDAQRVLAELTGSQTCPAGTNSLGVGPTVYCLEPVNR